MLRSFATLSLLVLVAGCAAPAAVEAPPAVAHEVVAIPSGDRYMVHTVHVDAPVADVWASHATAEGWMAWAAPLAEVDLRVGGTIRTHYGEGAAIGDPGTNTLHIVNYVPETLLTLRAELADNWPEIMQQDAERLTNVILFDALGPNRTRVRSYGIGYGDAPEYEQLLTFFASANDGLYRRLIEVLEER